MSLLTKPLLMILLLWGIASFSAADRRVDESQSARLQPIETIESTGALVPVYSSDQGMVVIWGNKVVILEGIDSQAWWWLVSQVGMQIVSDILLGLASGQYHSYGSVLPEPDADFKLIAGGYWRSQYMRWGVAGRNVWKNAREVGLWVPFAELTARFMLLKEWQYGIHAAAASAAVGVGSYIWNRDTQRERGKRRVYLNGMEAANLLVEMDFETEASDFNTKLTISRIKGSPIRDSKHSEFSSLARAMDQSQVSSITLNVVAPTLEHHSYFLLSYVDARGVSHSVRFNTEGSSKPWLINRFHQKSSHNNWQDSHTVLSPAGIEIVTQWLQASTDANKPFLLGSHNLVNSSGEKCLHKVFIHDSLPLETIRESSEGALRLGEKFTLSLPDNGWFSSSLQLSIPSSPDTQYVQYRIPRWLNHFLLTQTTKVTAYGISKGVNLGADRWGLSSEPMSKMKRTFKRKAIDEINARFAR